MSKEYSYPQLRSDSATGEDQVAPHTTLDPLGWDPVAHRASKQFLANWLQAQYRQMKAEDRQKQASARQAQAQQTPGQDTVMTGTSGPSTNAKSSVKTAGLKSGQDTAMSDTSDDAGQSSNPAGSEHAGGQPPVDNLAASMAGMNINYSSNPPSQSQPQSKRA